MLIQDKNIAIIGGGPGGLTLARLLQQKGATVNVYERDTSKYARVQGATLDLHEDSGLEALRVSGLLDAFKTHYRPGADKMRIVDKYATILVDDHERENYEESRPEIDRGPLRTLLLDSLLPDTVVWDSQFLSLTPASGSWKITFQNGYVAYADIVIAADGANSRIRPYLTPIKPLYSGVSIVEGNIYDAETVAPNLFKLVRGGKVFAFGDEKSLILSAKGDGSLSFYTGVKMGEYELQNAGIDFTDHRQVGHWFEKEYTGWSDIWLELFTSPQTYFIPRPQYCMPIDQTWEALPNLTMIGDAAHVMPPYAGEGVNMAMLDALELSQCLTSSDFSDIQSAIAFFENQMRARVSKIAQETVDQTEALHSPNAIGQMLAIVS